MFINDKDVLFRNNQLVKEGDLFLAVWNGKHGSHTADLVDKVKKVGKEVEVIDVTL